MWVFVISKGEMKIKADVNVKNWLIKIFFDKGFISNPGNYECECDKSCDVGQYLDY